MDKIYIKNLLVSCIIGVFPEEREKKQELMFNIELSTDLRAAGKSDNLADTVDYFALENEIVKMVSASSFQLIESLAERTAEICLADSKVSSVKVIIEKCGCLPIARSAAVEIVRA